MTLQRMNNTISHILLCIFVCLYCAACINTSSQKNQHKTTNTNTNNYNDTNTSHLNTSLSTISGHICYPSDFSIPAMNIYVKNITLGTIFSLLTKEDDTSYVFYNLPEGEYIAYAYTAESISGEKATGGYTFAVLCGLSVDCKDHRLISFFLPPYSSSHNINICDWYGALTPTE